MFHYLKNNTAITLGSPYLIIWGSPDSSVSKESSSNSGDLGSIPGLGRARGEGKGYPLQYSGLENSVGKSIGLQRVRHDYVIIYLVK